MRKINLVTYLVAFLFISISLLSCQNEQVDVKPPADVPTNVTFDKKNVTKLGEKLDNPYSVVNMKKALANLQSTGRNINNINVEATHLYIKFSPKNEDELSILQSDKDLILYTYPLDVEILKGGDYYHDPEVPEGQPTYQYCAVKVNQKLPKGIEYQVLEELFIPDEDKSEETSIINGRTISNADAEALITEALKITDNLDEDDAMPNARRRKWTPAGYIKLYDTQIGDYVGVEGIEVRARRWFTTRKGTTTVNGHFSCNGRFRRPANYSLKWEQYHFSVRSGNFGQAKYDGPKQKGDWNLNLGNSGSSVNDSQQYYATIFQAAYDYYYKDRFGLVSPPRNSTLKPQIKIAAKLDSDKSSHAAMYARTGGILPSIYIRSWERPSDWVYGTTIHELTHAAHWDMNRPAFRKLVQDAYNLNLDFNSGKKQQAEAVIESWPTGVEWVFTNHRYRNRFGDSTYNYDEGRQYFTINQKKVYTSLVIDLIDTENQRYTYGNGSSLYPQDRVEGYTILQIQEALRGAESWNAWRDNLKEKYNNSTEIYVDELFGNWH